MTGVIVCNGSIEDYTYYNKYFNMADLIICADGGAAHLIRIGKKPDILLGDFDSISAGDFKFLKELGVEILKYPVEKDMTDTELAVNLALDKGCTYIVIIGGIGSRWDHSLSNIFLLKKLLDRGIAGIIVNERNEISVIKDKIILYKEENAKISLLPLTEVVEGVTTKGLYYPLNNATIEMGSTWGISNEFISEIAEVSIKSGLMLVIKARD